VVEKPNPLVDQLPKLADELEGWEAELALLRSRISTRRRLIEALEEEARYFPGRPQTEGLFEPPPPTAREEPTDAPSNGRPSTGDAVLRVLGEKGRPMRAAEIFQEIAERGWAPEGKNPRASVGSALWYLAANNRLKKEGAPPRTRWVLADFDSVGGAETEG
jgi:hypothetical protein